MDSLIDSPATLPSLKCTSTEPVFPAEAHARRTSMTHWNILCYLTR